MRADGRDPHPGCTGLRELPWAFQKGFPRGENRPSGDIITPL